MRTHFSREVVRAIAICEAMALSYEVAPDDDAYPEIKENWMDLSSNFRRARAELETCANKLGIFILNQDSTFDSYTEIMRVWMVYSYGGDYHEVSVSL